MSQSPPTPTAKPADTPTSSKNSFAHQTTLQSPSSSNSASAAASKFIIPSLPPLLESTLWKKGSTFGGWTKRYFRFHPEHGRIFYSKDEDGPIRGEIILTKFTITALDATTSGGLPGQFIIDCPNKEHILRADDTATAQEWCDALEDLVKSNEKRKESLIQVTKSSNVGAVAARCAGCQTPFGILKSKVICSSCGFAFCASLKCVEPKSLQQGASTNRCCIPCAEIRDEKLPAVTSPSDKKSGPLGFLSTINPKLKPSNANLLIKVIAGRHLMICDSNNFSDPYCCIFFDGQEYRTDVQWKTLNPVWNQQFNIPIAGSSRDIQIGVYDSDRYSNDDFMGMVHIPLSELEPDKVFEDWFPLKPRPGKKSDKELPISGAIHLQIVRTESLFALFAPIWENQLPPEEKYSQGVLKHNVKRIQTIVESLELSWWQAKVDDIFEYKSPTISIIVLLIYWLIVLFYPAEWILPAIPILLLMKLAANFISDQNRIISHLEEAQHVHEKLGLMKHGKDNDQALTTKTEAEEDLDEYDEEDEEEQDERIAALGFLGKIRQYQKQLAKVQTVIGKACDNLEAVQNLFRWYDQRKSKFVAIALVAAFLFLLLMPFRLLLFLGGTGKWAKKLIGIVKKKLPKAKKPSEVENFLARAPTSTSLAPLKMHLVKKLQKS